MVLGVSQEEPLSREVSSTSLPLFKSTHARESHTAAARSYLSGHRLYAEHETFTLKGRLSTQTFSVSRALMVYFKEESVSGLITLMKLFPVATRFFINGWTWGYEDIYKAVAREFQTKVTCGGWYVLSINLISALCCRFMLTGTNTQYTPTFSVSRSCVQSSHAMNMLHAFMRASDSIDVRKSALRVEPHILLLVIMLSTSIRCLWENMSGVPMFGMQRIVFEQDNK